MLTKEASEPQRLLDVSFLNMTKRVRRNNKNYQFSKFKQLRLFNLPEI